MTDQYKLPSDNPYFVGFDNKNPEDIFLGKAFKSDTVGVQGADIYCVSGGRGRPIIFIHGFPQDWYEFSKVMRLLISEYTVISIDLRGIGQSRTTEKKFDAVTLAKDIHAIVKFYGIKNPYIVGHDMGGMVAYSYARLYHDETKGIAILDAPLPGTPSTDIMVKMPFLWHFSFHRIPKLPELLIRGHQYAYFRKAFFTRFSKNKQAMTDVDMSHYASSYKTSEQLRSGLGLYRAYKENRLFMRTQRKELKVPILLIESDYGTSEPGSTAKQLKEKFNCLNVTAKVVGGCGHFMPEENPQAIADFIRRYA